jgi:hypothetical protein
MCRRTKVCGYKADAPKVLRLPAVLTSKCMTLEMVLELISGADFWCNRHCRTSPVVLEGFWGQVWPKIGRKPENTEFRIANEPLSLLLHKHACQLG